MNFRSLIIIPAFLLFAFSISTAQKRKFVDFEIYYDPTAKKAPGAIVPIGVKAIKRNGKEVITKGFLKGDRGWKNFIVQVNGGSFFNGNVQIDPDVRNIHDDQVEIKVFLEEDPLFGKSVFIKLNYINNYVADFSGADGKSGVDGNEGPRKRETGRDGGDGQDGRDGEDVDVFVKTKSAGSEQFLLVLINNRRGGQSQAYKINVNGGSLNVNVSGGNGGAGGDGEDGADGIGDAYGADGGNAGNGGYGGNAGSIKIIADPAAEPYLSLISTSTNGGKAGIAGRRGSGGSKGSAAVSESEKRKTIIGKLVASDGDGKKGSSGSDGREGAPASGVEVLIQNVEMEY